jgi:signal transduction histidine kinase
VAPELRAAVFQPFFTTKPRGQGTGLGLAICRDIVRDHGGTIEVADHAGGAMFVVWLPASHESG